MHYYLDTEFNEFGGDLISLALVRDDGESLYVVFPSYQGATGEWVAANVLPIVPSVPAFVEIIVCEDHADGSIELARFLKGDPAPCIVTDWPDDVRWLCQLLITGPGQMIGIPSATFEMRRVDAYPTTLTGAVQHNAWWDAMALRHLLNPEKAAA